MTKCDPTRLTAFAVADKSARNAHVKHVAEQSKGLEADQAAASKIVIAGAAYREEEVFVFVQGELVEYERFAPCIPATSHNTTIKP